MATKGSSRPSHCVHTSNEKKRFVPEAPTTGVSCVLQTTRVGLLAAVVEPSSAQHLRVAEPARTSARDLTLALSTRLCCVTRATLHSDDKTLLMNCKLCHRSTSGDTVYLYMSMGFCSRNCRHVYHQDEVEKYKKRPAMALMERSKIVTRMVASKANNKLATQATCCRPTFFTCAE